MLRLASLCRIIPANRSGLGVCAARSERRTGRSRDLLDVIAQRLMTTMVMLGELRRGPCGAMTTRQRLHYSVQSHTIVLTVPHVLCLR